MRLIDADALSKAMYDEAFENDESYNETNPMARWDSGLWIRYKMFENILKESPTIEPNLVINPEEVERGDVVEIGENIVVMHHDDYYDMFLKSELYDDIEPCEDAISPSGEWIPCSEKLPQYRDVVLISTYWGVRVAERDGTKEDGTDDFWYLFLDDATAHPRYVYAWMPLPDWNDALDAVQNGKFIINDDRKDEPQTERSE